MKVHLRIGISEEIERPFAVSFAEKILKIKGEASLSITSGDHRETIDTLRDYTCEAALINQSNLSDDITLLNSIAMPVVFVVGRKLLREKNLHVTRRTDVLSLIKRQNFRFASRIPN